MKSRAIGLLADPPRWGRDFGHDHGGRPGPFAFLVFLFLAALVLGVVLLLVFRLVERRRPAPPVAQLAGRADPALEALRLRYARGEVDAESFARISADLGATVTASFVDSPPGASPTSPGEGASPT